MRVKGKFCIREILDEIVAIPLESGDELFRGIISLNEVGRFLFDRLAEEQTVSQLVQAVLEEYEVSEEIALSDVQEFLNVLREHGLLEE